MPKHKDITGQKFGRLTVIERHHQDVRKAWHWLCKCDCGNEIICGIGSLTEKKGGTKSCGCLQRDISTRDITEQRFGRLIAVERHHQDKRKTWHWLCKCDCGNECIVNGSYLRSGHTQSCGCYKKERGIIANTSHGLSQAPIGRVLAGMKRRCYNPNTMGHKDYGGRGIYICIEWREDPSKFFEWAEKSGYKKGLTIERIDNDGPYSPENCRWATPKEQANNRRNTLFLTYEGKTWAVSKWADYLGLSRQTIYSRLRSGKSIEEALSIA